MGGATVMPIARMIWGLPAIIAVVQRKQEVTKRGLQRVKLADVVTNGKCSYCIELKAPH